MSYAINWLVGLVTCCQRRKVPKKVLRNGNRQGIELIVKSWVDIHFCGWRITKSQLLCHEAIESGIHAQIHLLSRKTGIFSRQQTHNKLVQVHTT